eukprot:CAMPEP_0170546264 /NCGR_PEP_ID=MMETSP0211-20121228/4633_1 /TAXON_ID=311385 /ORGANISM="Pseudokeronopsis sp., Strain OXSARD2" /LENGTH=51 /DNA_ID=CAMNT_0010850635 /DNA_START=1549 /DNA_END=1704 /DNA_ORIENTATION=+
MRKGKALEDRTSWWMENASKASLEASTLTKTPKKTTNTTSRTFNNLEPFNI